MNHVDMTDEEMIEALVHLERFLKRCHASCKLNGEILHQYNSVVRLGNTIFENMQEYRDQFNDPTG